MPQPSTKLTATLAFYPPHEQAATHLKLDHRPKTDVRAFGMTWLLLFVGVVVFFVSTSQVLYAMIAGEDEPLGSGSSSFGE